MALAKKEKLRPFCHLKSPLTRLYSAAAVATLCHDEGFTSRSKIEVALKVGVKEMAMSLRLEMGSHHLMV